jgi:hypothetical protein
MRRLLFSLIGISALLLGSCSQDTGIYDGSDPIPAGNVLGLEIRVDGQAAQAARTRTPVDPVGIETEIESLFLLFFEPDADRGGEFVDYVNIPDIAEPKDRWKIDLTGTRIDLTAPYHILAIANAEDYLNGADVDSWIRTWSGKSETEVMTRAVAWTKEGIAEPDRLLMSGRVEKARDQFGVTVDLTRNQARFDVLNEKKEDYQVVSVQLRNAYPSALVWNNGKADDAFQLDYTEEFGRISDYYTYRNPNPGENILGHLYVFENQVTKPTRNDRFTTCMIIELKDMDRGTNSFYRANIVPRDDAQTLRRNNVYKLTITNVGGPGQATAEEAYNYPDNNQLDYKINYWDGESGGVYVHDASSILSIPVKTIRFTGAGGEQTYDIFTFSNSANPTSPLDIRSQEYDSPGITASHEGNVLKVVATPTAGPGVVRTGKIRLSFAGLVAEINVIQTDQLDKVLRVHLPDGGIPRLAPFGGISTDQLRVEASGAWTAEIFAEEGSGGGFSFRQDGSLPVREIGTDPAKAGTNDPGRADPIANNRFRVWTFGANPASAPREAFIVVSLDEDPENYVQVIRVSQAAAAGIAIVPNQTVTFDGMGQGLALIPNNTSDTFVIRPAEVGTGSIDPISNQEIMEFAEWNATIEGPDRAMFSIVRITTETDVTRPNGNTVQVEANGMNNAGRTYNAQLVVTLADNSSAKASVNLVQVPANINLSPGSVPLVAVAGGETQLISVQGDATLKWKASVSTGTTGVRGLTHHEAWLEDESGNRIAPDTEFDMTRRFRVAFPKVYFPNRQQPITATVTVSVGEGITKTMTVGQTPLEPRALVAHVMRGSTTWGVLGTSAGNYTRSLTASFTNAGFKLLSAQGITSPVNPTATLLSAALNNSGSWAQVDAYMKNFDAWSILSTTASAAPFDASPMRALGYASSYSLYANGSYYVTNDSRYTSTKIFQFLMDKSPKQPLAANTIINFYNDGIGRVMIAQGMPSTGVPIIANRNANDGNLGNATMVIDIRNKFVWMGESQHFDAPGNVTGNRKVFMDNLVLFMTYASLYGSHFTDMLLEESQGGTHAPWDSAYWGRNVNTEIR